MLSGEKRPKIGMAGCHFIPGQWSQIDRILGLQKSRVFGNTGNPNYAKPGNGFSSNGRKLAKKDSIPLDDFRIFPIIHKPGKGSLTRPGDREAPAASIAGERV